MDAIVLNRLVLAVLIIVMGYLTYQLVNRWSLNRSRILPHGLENLPPGVLGILYFTTPNCMPCKTVQRPALETVKKKFGQKLKVIEVDATQQTALADHWGVLSVPTTFIIDANGQARKVNHGVVRAEKLIQQLKDSE